MISIEDCVELAIRGDKIDSLQAVSVLKRSKKDKILEDWEEKVQYLRQSKEEVISVALRFRMEI